MLDIKVETFLSVCQEMNYTKAAKKLNITQPAVSMHIKNLEDYYGVPLFAFEGKRFQLTKYGKLLYDSLLSMQNNEKYLKEQLRIIKNKSNIINMGATLTVGEFMIAKSISHYIKSHPEADVSVIVSNTKELLRKLDSGAIDFAILEGDFSKSSYFYETLFNLEFIPICSSKHSPWQVPLAMQNLTGERLIIREPGSGTRKILEVALEQYGLSIEDFKNVTMIGNMNAIIDLVADNCGITFLYKNAVTGMLSQKEVMEIPISDFHVTHEISIIWKKENMQNSYIRNLIHELFNICI